MADFIEERKKQKRLILVLTLVLLITASVLWYGFFRTPPGEALKEEKEVAPAFEPSLDVDFDVLETPAFKNLAPFEGVTPFEGERGRENPFAPI